MSRARNYIPALKFGHKIYPEDIAGMIGLPVVGDIYYVNATTGASTNSGSATNQAFNKVSTAHSSLTEGQNDVAILVANEGTVGGAGDDVSEVSVTWNKGFSHLIGAASPVGIAGRARVTSSSGTSSFFTFSGDGCIISNIQIGTFEDINVNTTVTGQRNYFNNVHFAGIGNATAGDDTAARSLVVSGGGSGKGENVFDGCVIGLDTVARSTTNAELELTTSATRNLFRNCYFPTFADNAGHLFIKADASAAAIDRFAFFENCIFHNAIHSTGTNMTEAIAAHGSLSGTILLKDCTLVGATDWENSASGQVMIDGAAPTAGSSGLAVDVA